MTRPDRGPEALRRSPLHSGLAHLCDVFASNGTEILVLAITLKRRQHRADRRRRGSSATESRPTAGGGVARLRNRVTLPMAIGKG